MVVVRLVDLGGFLILLGLVAVFAVVELKNILLDFEYSSLKYKKKTCQVRVSSSLVSSDLAGMNKLLL